MTNFELISTRKVKNYG